MGICECVCVCVCVCEAPKYTQHATPPSAAAAAAAQPLLFSQHNFTTFMGKVMPDSALARLHRVDPAVLALPHHLPTYHPPTHSQFLGRSVPATCTFKFQHFVSSHASRVCNILNVFLYKSHAHAQVGAPAAAPASALHAACRSLLASQHTLKFTELHL